MIHPVRAVVLRVQRALVARADPASPVRAGQVIVELKIRKGGALIYDKKGRYKVKRWKLTIRQNKGEDKTNFKARLSSFNSIMIDLFNKHRVQTDPPSSDSRQ